MQYKRKKPLTDEDFEYIYGKVTRLTVDVVVKVGDSIVLVKRKAKSWNGTWHIPGGTVLYREKLTDAVLRIAKEELGLDVRVEKFIDYIEYPSEEATRGYGYSISMAFLCTPTVEMNNPNWEGEGIKLFSKLPSKFIDDQRSVLVNVLKQ